MKDTILNKLQSNPVAQQMLQFGNNIGNLFPNEEALCMASAFMQDKQTRIVVKKNRYEAQQLYQRLKPLINDTLLFVMEESLRVQAIASSPEDKQEQLYVLTQLVKEDKPRIIICNTAAFLRYLPDKELFKSLCFKFEVDQEITMAELKQKLNRAGYTKVNYVDRPCTYASRGGIVDVYCLEYEHPIRIEFFDTVIESIRLFHEETQRTIKTIDSVFINPATDLLFTDEQINYLQKEIDKELEKQIMNKFNINEAIVIECLNNSEEEVITEIGIAAANYFSNIIDKVKNVGISWGQSLSSMIEQLNTKNSSVVNIMIGATGYENKNYDGPLLAQYLSKKLNSQCLMIHAPLVVGNKEIAKSLMNDNTIKNILKKISNLDIAFVGIGCVELKNNSLYKTGYISEEELNKIKNEGAIGDICAHYYDINGKELDIDINNRVIGAKLSDLKKIKNVVGVASGLVKSKAVYSALIGKYLNTIIIDSELAKSLLNL